MNEQSAVAGEWANENDNLPEDFFDDLPKPTFWRMVIMPLKPKEVSKGGIVLAPSNQEAQAILNFMGRVVAVGPLAGVHERLGGDGEKAGEGFPKVGDYVIYGRYAGQPMIFRNQKLLIINDDEILGTVPNPDLLKVAHI
jgi:co-chaperonin GroES (HSP10)